MKVRDRIFPIIERFDQACHARNLPTPLCRLVGRMEIGYYERTTDWENPVYINPDREPELYARFGDRLCPHGWRENCPRGCPRD